MPAKLRKSGQSGGTVFLYREESQLQSAFSRVRFGIFHLILPAVFRRGNTDRFFEGFDKVGQCAVTAFQ